MKILLFLNALMFFLSIFGFFIFGGWEYAISATLNALGFIGLLGVLE